MISLSYMPGWVNFYEFSRQTWKFAMRRNHFEFSSMSATFLLLLPQHQADPEEGVQVREQVRQAAKEGGWVQLPQPAEDRQEEGVHHGRRGAWSKFQSRPWKHTENSDAKKPRSFWTSQVLIENHQALSWEPLSTQASKPGDSWQKPPCCQGCVVLAQRKTPRLIVLIQKTTSLFLCGNGALITYRVFLPKKDELQILFSSWKWLYLTVKIVLARLCSSCFFLLFENRHRLYYHKTRKNWTRCIKYKGGPFVTDFLALNL